jgi:hypothetical protein
MGQPDIMDFWQLFHAMVYDPTEGEKSDHLLGGGHSVGML